jgi:hypothetical protein
MKYNIYLKETRRLSNVTKFCDGKLLPSYEGKWVNNPGINQNLDIFIVSDDDWEIDSAIILKRDMEIYAGFISRNKEKYSKIVMTNDQEFNRCKKTLPITNDILEWICNNPESKEIPLEKVCVNIINKGIEEFYRIKTNPMIFMEEATKYVVGCDPIDDNSPTLGCKIIGP